MLVPKKDAQLIKRLKLDRPLTSDDEDDSDNPGLPSSDIIASLRENPEGTLAAVAAHNPKSLKKATKYLKTAKNAVELAEQAKHFISGTLGGMNNASFDCPGTQLEAKEGGPTVLERAPDCKNVVHHRATDKRNMLQKFKEASEHNMNAKEGDELWDLPVGLSGRCDRCRRDRDKFFKEFKIARKARRQGREEAEETQEGTEGDDQAPEPGTESDVPV